MNDGQIESQSAKWPKIVPELTPEQKTISDDFMKHWHEVLPRRFGLIERFNHGYPVKHAPKTFMITLEIGAGLGEHVAYETLTNEQEASYIALDIRPNMVAAIRQRFPRIQAMVGDCQGRIDLPDGHCDRILAIHVLEHLPNLPAAVREMRRVCNQTTGVVSVVIPCEGSLAYGLARRISAQRIFEKRYGQSYRWFIEREHLNKPAEILSELEGLFTVRHQAYFPFPVPFEFCNLCLGLTLTPKTSPRIDHGVRTSDR
jgi:SAM-dependent methyltransferase